MNPLIIVGAALAVSQLLSCKKGCDPIPYDPNLPPHRGPKLENMTLEKIESLKWDVERERYRYESSYYTHDAVMEAMKKKQYERMRQAFNPLFYDSPLKAD